MDELKLMALRRIFQQTGEQVEVDFRKMVNWVRLGDQLTHQIHPYPAKLLPNIAHFFIRASILTKQGCPILDPFCGSGTVALEASLAGFTPYVADANPLSLLITKAKTTPYEPEELRLVAQKIVNRASRLRTAPEVHIVNHHLWYTDDRKKSLEILLRAVMETVNESQRDFFLVCFSVVARRLSLADPAISVPVRLKVKDHFTEEVKGKISKRLSWISNASPTSEFAKVCEENIERILQANNAQPDRVAAVEVGIDARELKSQNTEDSHLVNDQTIPLIVTSPPYGSAQKYVRATSLSLNWLGFTGPNELSTLESRSIGREHVPQYREVGIQGPLPAAYEKLLNKIGKKNRTRARITRTYLHEMKNALMEMARVSSKGGHIVLVIGNNQVCGETLRNDLYIINVLQELGLNLEVSLIDHIKSRGLMTKRNKTASIISRECVLIFKKL